MAIIYTYPVKTTPANDDLILISDSEAEDPKKATKQVKISSLPGGSAAGVSSFNTLTGAVTITGGTNVTLNPVGNNIEINASGGGTPANPTSSVQFNNAGAFGGSANLTFSTNTLAVTHTVDIKGDGTNAGKLKLYCENTTTPHAITIEGPAHSGAAAYTLKLPSPAPSNQQILQSDGSGVLSWINTPSSGGGGSVDSVNTTDGTFINLTPNSATTGAVTVTADLSATGTAGNTTFLRGDNQWAVPAGTTYSAGTGLALNTTTFSLAAGAALANLGGGSGSTFLKKDGTWATPADLNTNIGTNDLTLAISRTLNFYSDGTDRTLTFINTNGGSKNLFKFDQIGNTTPRFTVGHTESAYEGYVVLEGNGSNRTGILRFENAAGSYYTSIQAPNTFASNANIAYVLPNAQGANNTYLKNDGSGNLSWATVSSGTTTNIANSNLTLDNNRTLDFYDGSNSRSLTFISTASGGSKNLFKFEAAGGTAPTMYAGNTESAYEGYIILEGNGSNRTGQLKFENAGGTYSTAFKATTTQSADITYTLPATIGTQNQVLEISSVSGGNATLGWAAAGGGDTYTLQAEAKSGISVPLKLDAGTGTDSTVNLTEGSNITLTRNSASQITIASSGGGGSLGFAPLEIYSANDNSQASYIYYMVAVCDVDFTVNKCKVAVTSGTDPVYVAVYSMNYGSLQTSTLTLLGRLNNSGSLTGVNELSLTDSAFSLTAGQTICVGVSTSCQLASGVGINNTALGVMATSGGGSALPTTPDFEGLGSANRRPAIHFYAS